MLMLHKIIIDGFKSIEHAELELGSLNVVIGANGSGKSNFIGIFRLLEHVLSHNLQLHVASEPDRLLHHGRKKTQTLSLDFKFDQHTSRRWRRIWPIMACLCSPSCYGRRESPPAEVIEAVYPTGSRSSAA